MISFGYSYKSETIFSGAYIQTRPSNIFISEVCLGYFVGSFLSENVPENESGPWHGVSLRAVRNIYKPVDLVVTANYDFNNTKKGNFIFSFGLRFGLHFPIY